MIKENACISKKREIGQLFSDEIRESVKKCYSCLKCVSGCPVASAMDLTPGVMIKRLALGDFESVFNSNAIWVCSSCQTCCSRCPFDIDIPHIIDLLKEYAHKNRLGKKEKPVQLFHEIFLSHIRKFGRIHEAGLIGKWKVSSGRLFSDLALGMKMFFKGKLSIFPERIKGKKEVKKFFTGGTTK